MGVHSSTTGTTAISTWNQRLRLPLHPSVVHFEGLKASRLSAEETSLLKTADLSQLSGGCRRIEIKVAAAASISAPRREKDPKKRVVITGMGCVSVFGTDVDVFYDKLLQGMSGVSLIDRFDASSFPTKFAAQIRDFSGEGYIDAKNMRRFDDSIKYCLVSGKKAMEHAGLTGEHLNVVDKLRVGVVVGCGVGGVTVMTEGIQTILEKGIKRLNPFFIPYSMGNMGSALLAIDLGLMGPNYSISAAWATSNYCFYAAANHIQLGEVDIMVAGGTEACVTPLALGGFAAGRALSQRNDAPHTASRPWDKDRDGLVMGEGAGALIMESLDHALKRRAPILAEYLGGAITSDAYHITKPRIHGLSLSNCIEKSLENAGVSPEEVNYINACANSTILGDIAEVNAIKRVFKNTSEIKVNGTKSMIGHGLSASGAHEAIATIKAIETGWLHPTINQFNQEECVTFDVVPNVKKQHQVHVAISNCFGYGGVNSCIVLAPYSL